MYLTYLVLFVLTTRLYRDRTPVAVVKSLLGAAIPVTLYGLLQSRGIDPYGWRAVEGGPQVFATFGNANFYAAYLGVVVPLAVWGALTRTWATSWRVASGVLAALALLAAYASNSQQGPGVAVLGSVFVVAVWIATHGRLSNGVKAGLLGAGALAGVAGAVALAAGVGPLAGLRQGLQFSLGTRTPKWETALAIWRDHPVFGVGLERFADYFHEYRSPALAVASGIRRTTDTPHNIPLDMLANGGLLLLVAYLAFVGATLWALAVGLRRNRGEDRLLLAGLGGAWLAYQLQSLVSIDVPPVAVLHYVLAGLIVALGTRPAMKAIALPGARPEVAPSAPKGKKGKARPARTPVVPANRVLTGAIAVVALAALFVVTTPVRADVAAGGAVRAANREEAVAAYDRAAEVAFWEARYPALEGAYLTNEGGDALAALGAHREAARREPRALAHVLNVARLSAQLGQNEQAAEAYERALEIDPTTPEVLVEAGEFRLAQGDTQGAAELIDRAGSMADGNARVLLAVGRVRAAQEEPDEARAAIERALQIDPAVPGGTEALASLDGVA
jgi:O-antigen ligase